LLLAAVCRLAPGCAALRGTDAGRPDHARGLCVIEDCPRQSEPALRLDERADGSLLGGGDLQGQVPARPQKVDGRFDQTPDGTKTVGTAVQRDAGLVIAYARLEEVDLVCRNIGRIGNDRVEWALSDNRSELVAEAEIDAVRHTQARGIGSGDLESRLGY